MPLNEEEKQQLAANPHKDVYKRQITGRAALDAAKHDRLTIERMAGELKTKAPQVEERRCV